MTIYFGAIELNLPLPVVVRRAGERFLRSIQARPRLAAFLRPFVIVEPW